MTEFEYDPYSSRLQEDPYGTYRIMRDQFPVYQNERLNLYALTRFEDVLGALRNPSTFVSGKVAERAHGDSMIYHDPPDHTRLRTFVNRRFTPRRVNDLEPAIRATAQALLDRVPEGGEIDLIHDFAVPLPGIVISELLGLPDDQRADFQRWSETFVNLTEQNPVPPIEALTGFKMALSELLEDRSLNPRDDFTTTLLEADHDGDRLTRLELQQMLQLLVVAGHDTTANLIGNGFVLFAQHPESLRQLVRHQELLPRAIEEVLRYEPPAQALPRITSCDVELHGKTIPEGSRVLLVFGAANHDEREFEDPERFDISRMFERHLAFGYGPHFCLGVSLARLEARVAFEELFTRFPNCELLDQSPARLTSKWARAFRSVPVRLGQRAGDSVT